MPDSSLGLAAAEAEAAAAEAAAAAAAAEATAAEARARAARLRRDAEVNQNPTSGQDPAGDDAHDTARTETSSLGDDDPATTDAQRGRATRFRTIAAAVAVVAICASLAATAYMTVQHRQVESENERAAEFTAAAKQGIVSLTSLDFNNAEADVQRVLDSSTGEFRDDFTNKKDDFTSVIQQSQVATQGEVNATAVESMTDDSAVVLVSATSRVTNSAGAQEEPRAWRLSVTVVDEGDQIKMSKVDFVP